MSMKSHPIRGARLQTTVAWRFIEIYRPFNTHTHTCYSGYEATANNQRTINPKEWKMPSLGSRPESIIAFQDLRFYQCTHLVSCYCSVQARNNQWFPTVHMFAHTHVLKSNSILCYTIYSYMYVFLSSQFHWMCVSTNSLSSKNADL